MYNIRVEIKRENYCQIALKLLKTGYIKIKIQKEMYTIFIFVFETFVVDFAQH